MAIWRRPTRSYLHKSKPEGFRQRRQPRKDAQRTLAIETCEPRLLFAVAPQLVSIIPSAGGLLVDGQVRNEAPRELTFRFSDQQQIDASSVADGIQMVRGGGDGIIGNGNDVVVAPGFMGIGDRPNEVVMRFAEHLPDDLYQVRIVGGVLKNTDGLFFNNGADSVTRFELDLGPQIVAVVPQPISRNASGQLSQRRNEIEIYFNNDDLNAQAATNPAFYQLIRTRKTASNLDDTQFTPSSVSYIPAEDKVVLTFGSDLASLGQGDDVFRLRVGNSYSAPVAAQVLAEGADAADTFASATTINSANLLAGTVIVAGEIIPLPFNLQLPGSNKEPGHRDLPSDLEFSHLDPTSDQDLTDGVTTIPYNFRDDYGTDPAGNPLHNLITPAQKERAREVFSYFSKYLGIQFYETPASGFTIVTGDLRALDPTVPTGPGGVIGLAGGGMAIMDNAEDWGDSEVGGGWFGTAMHEIGHLLGLGHTYDLPLVTIMGDDVNQGANPDALYPGDHDLVHARRLHRPDSIDIDVYKFSVAQAGTFAAETVAERLSDSSLLDTVISVFDAAGNLVARNDDYYSEDSFVGLELQPGDYFVVVTSTGNTEFNPAAPGSGFGGTSQGKYELRLDFKPLEERSPTANSGIVDNDGSPTLLDGDADGRPGGAYNFWIDVASSADTIYVDKANTQPNPDGSLAKPFTNLQQALAAAIPGKIVRVVGNGGADGNLATVTDNLAYEIGFNSLGQPLADGAELQVPKGVTLMVDAGAIFKLRRTNIDVGSKSQGVDRSEGALQVLGTPRQSVIFTSYHNESIGKDTFLQPTTPAPGDWGGIVFRNELDFDARRTVLEDQGIFLSSVQFAQLTFGGGDVLVNGVQGSFSPIEMNEARPAVSFNLIQSSAGAAISADPNSFKDNRISDVETKSGTDRFTADYQRVGPEIHDNRLLNNTINGLFVRINAAAGQLLDRLEVSARFDDTDIVHVIAENLLIKGTPGGPEGTDLIGPLAARRDGRLAIDPGIVVKLDGARIETEIGAQLIAEGTPTNRVIFTSLLDDRFGAGGTFDTAAQVLAPFSTGTVSITQGIGTLFGGAWPAWAAGAILTVNGTPYTVATRNSNTQITLVDRTVTTGAAPFTLTGSSATNMPSLGDWGGLNFGPLSHGSLDNVLLTYGGGETPVDGGFAAFNVVQIQQADVRIARSILEKNAGGTAGRAQSGFGNGEGVIFVRGAQPTIVENTIRDNAGPAISINVNALNSDLVQDPGASRGPLNRTGEYLANQGALIRGNRLGNNGINGLDVRGATLTTQSVWDDTDIVHVLRSEVRVPNFHTLGGLRLQSSGSESLVVKLQGATAGFSAQGIPIDIRDRIGGAVQVVGTPGHPVVLTSLNDSSVGAGVDPEGRTQTRTGGVGGAAQGAKSRTNIEFRFNQNVAANPAAVAAFNLAAAAWEAVLDDPITIVIDTEFAAINAAGLGGGVPELRSYDEVRQLMINDAAADESIVSRLPTFAQLKATAPVGVTVSPSMVVNRANLLALGVDPSQLTVQPSAYDPLTPIDGTVQMNSGLVWDFDPTDGITPGMVDFYAVALHEIGHVLGFVSAVDGANAPGATSVQLNTLDLFRLAPGAGTADFTNSPRILDSTAPNHVFYDGGFYTQAGVTGGIFQIGDIPLSRGTTTDGWQSSHWKDTGQLGGAAQIGIMSPVGLPGERINRNDGRAFGLIGYDVVGRGAAGDWRSIRLEQYSNDRNVPVAVERERSADTNKVPLAAEPLGSLAPNLASGDETLRLGFEVEGVLSTNGDVDVYSFSARAGTEVWIDLDRTTQSLDSVVELIDADGRVRARSDNSYDENLDATKLFSEGVAVYPLKRDIFNGVDHYSVNPLDAGMRLILPGPAGALLNYYVRVRSKPADPADLSDPTKVAAGTSRGAYQLQVRLKEVDEIPGSSVQYADIRFSTNGIEVLGTPLHSPLVGDAGEITEVPGGANNDGQATAQNIGNPLVQERGSISLAGALSTWRDVDWYQFTVNWANEQDIPGLLGRFDKTASLIFDMDYADGAGRPDTTLSIFDSTGTLIYIARASDVEDDQPPGGQGSGNTDLTRGSFGQFDPYLGPAHLPENTNLTYYVAVSSNARRPSVLDLPSVRMEPISAIDRVVDDRVGSQFIPPALLPGSTPSRLFDPNVQPLNVYADPFHLGDVSLYVMAGNNISIVDPFTGVAETDVGLVRGVANFGYGDFAMRNDGRLFSLTLGATDANAGQFAEFDVSTAAETITGDDGIATLQPPPLDVGFQFQALTFRQNYNSEGNRILVGAGPDPLGRANINHIYFLNANTGVAEARANPDNLPPSDPRPRGVALDTSANRGPGGDLTGIAYVNATLYLVSSKGGFYSWDGMALTYISTLRDDRGLAIPFSGLTAGPRNVENGYYADKLFAIDEQGRMWAIGTTKDPDPMKNQEGVLLGIFHDGAKSVRTGLLGTNGLAFSTLDYNLWHVTGRREGDPGHGLDPTPDRVRNRRIDGGSSFYFGFERGVGQPGALAFPENDARYGTYNLPGGARGSLTSETIDLSSYNQGDLPTLYFTYLIQHDSPSVAQNNIKAYDAFRVYASNDGADWTLLGQSSIPINEPNGYPVNLVNGAAAGSTEWRQARLDMSPMAGLDKVRLRFEFSTDGGRNVGEFSVGTEMSARDGGELADGSRFTVSTDPLFGTAADNVTFEFDMGFSLTVPNGGATLISDGEKFRLDNGRGQTDSIKTFEFDKAGNGVSPGNVRIDINSTMSAVQVRDAIRSAIAGAVMPGVIIHPSNSTKSEGRLNLEGIVNVQQSGAANGLVVEGDAPGTVTRRNVAVPIFADMAANDVAIAIATAMDNYFTVTATNGRGMDLPDLFTSVKLDEAHIAVVGRYVVDDRLVKELPSTHPFLLLPGDPIPRGLPNRNQLRYNDFEGVYIDDFVIGLAGRGEMALNAPAGTTDFTIPDRIPADQVLSGAYQLEIRRSTAYGFPINVVGQPQRLQLIQTYNANHRFVPDISLDFPEPESIQPGTMFIIDDGLRKVSFEFDLTGTGSVGAGRTAVDISAARTNADVALAVTNSINGHPLFAGRAKLASAVPVGFLDPIYNSNRVYLSYVGDVTADIATGIVVNIGDVDAPNYNLGGDYSDYGDANVPREQGQIILDSNIIRDAANYGVRIDSGVRTGNNSVPHPGAVRNLNDFNASRLIRGVVVSNNVIAQNATGGIFYSGDPGTDPLAPVSFGRIVQNTIFGGLTPTGIGINLNESVSPTLLNNVLSGLSVGVQVDASSASAVLGGNLFHRNSTNVQGISTGTFPIVVPASEELFVNAELGNFYPAAGSRVIDSSINNLQDRPQMTSVNNPLGIPASPILAPDRDALGQLRVNDPTVNSPPGQGSNVFKDRGAIERADFSGPSAELFDPRDNDPQGRDLDPTVTRVLLGAQQVTQFALQLVDGVEPADPAFGAGVDDSTVDPRLFTLLRDGVALVLGEDYTFSYNSNSNVVSLIPTQGVWTPNHVYVIQINNNSSIVIGEEIVPGLVDLAGNSLKPNQIDGTTRFTIEIASVDFGDAPDPNYPTLFMRTDAGGTAPGAYHRIVAGLQLGSQITAEVDGQPSSNAGTDLGDDGVKFSGDLVPGQNAPVVVTASAAGKLDAWIDFNGDGDWNDPGEQVFTSVSVVSGANNLSVAVPAGLAPGRSYARFRLSSAGGLAPFGPADDGEVEDYAVQLAPLAKYDLVLGYSASRELYRDAFSRYFVSPGQTIVAQVYVDDQRTDPTAGVRAAFADLLYDNDLIDWELNSLTFGPSFTTGQSGVIDEANNLVDEAGGVAIASPGPSKQLLFTVTGVIKPTALKEEVFKLTLKPADDPGRTTELFNFNQPVTTQFDSETVVITDRPWQNLRSPFDVNANGFVTSQDALIIINRLNNPQGGGNLPNPPVAPNTPQPFYDVNGDNRITSNDVLRVINALNSGRGGPVFVATGDSEGAVVLAAAPMAATPVFATPAPATRTLGGTPLSSSLNVTAVAISVAAGPGGDAADAELGAIGAALAGFAEQENDAVPAAVVRNLAAIDELVDTLQADAGSEVQPLASRSDEGGADGLAAAASRMAWEAFFDDFAVVPGTRKQKRYG